MPVNFDGHLGCRRAPSGKQLRLWLRVIGDAKRRALIPDRPAKPATSCFVLSCDVKGSHDESTTRRRPAPRRSYAAVLAARAKRDAAAAEVELVVVRSLTR